MPARWNIEKENQLTDLVNSGQYTYIEIAKIMGLNVNQCRTKGQDLGLKNPVYSERIKKHQHLREPAMKYFLTHTWEETRNHFGLTQSNLKALFTAGYKDPKLKHLRKETRRHDSWSVKELVFLARHAGLQRRVWIAKRLNRGGVHSVKEAVTRLSSNTRYLNGIPSGWVRSLLPKISNNVWRVKVKAGPTAPGVDCRPILVPWVELESAIKHQRVEPTIRMCIRAMAKFQRWMHGSDDDDFIKRRIRKAATHE